ncbi:MAG TPA: sulfatase-like hydrolase/transferase [Bryobacteraceae bacterium]|nr:sulfatase-like hydrolase/transferase [Bryobacteraceae bacterium]
MLEPAPKGHVKRRWRAWHCVAIGLSFANLAAFQRWKPMLGYSDSDAYFMKLPPAPAEYWAAIVSVLTLGGILSLITIFVSRIQAGRLLRIARCVWLLLLLKVAVVFASPLRSLLLQLFGEYRLPLLSIAGLLLVLSFALWPVKIFPWAMYGLLILSPFAAVTIGEACWRAMRYDPVAFLDKATAPPLPADPAGPRVVWLILDEMDQRLIFEDRDASLQLPEIDRLRGVSVYASRAYPPGGSTSNSIPSLILGKRVVAMRPAGPSDLLLSENGTAKEAGWAGQANVFSRVRTLGLNAGVVGWYHPYCRVLDAELARCHWVEMEEWVNVTRRTFAQSLLNQLGMIVFLPHAQSLAMEARTRRRNEIVSAALAMVRDRSIQLSFLHFHGAHVPYVYNRFERQFITNDPDGHGYNPRHYLDGLALADRSVGRLRTALEEAHVWGATTVLVSSDHWYRQSQALDGKTDKRVPFLLKMAGQTASVQYDTPFNTALTQGLVVAILRKEVASPQDALAWLDRHRNDTPLLPLE